MIHLAMLFVLSSCLLLAFGRTGQGARDPQNRPANADDPRDGAASAVFRSFEYRGTGPREIPEGHYANPVQPGFYPDPTICRVGDDYYMTHSTFAYFPGLPIFHSRDLVSWTLIGHAMDRPSQLMLDGADVSQGLFAPAITEHEGRFYIVCTNVSSGGNFVITAEDPRGPWSEPTFLPPINGIDPSIFFDTDGKAYLIHNGPPPDNRPLYDGHRALWLFEFDAATLTVNAASGKLIINGGVDLSKKPIWIEGPHINKRYGWYYITAAEGGTGPQHSQVVFRSRSIWGPYEPWDQNPILTQRDLPADRPAPITCTGHADLVQTQDGQWWTVFLASRPFEGDGTMTHLGRETFLLPVDWSGEWPIITRPGEVLTPTLPRPRLRATDGTMVAPDANPSVGQVSSYVWRDDFESDQLDASWIFLRTPRETWHALGGERPSLRVRPRPVALTSREQPSFIARRQLHAEFVAEVTLDLSGMPDADAGLVIFQNAEHHLFLGVAAEGGVRTLFIEAVERPGRDQGPVTRRLGEVTLTPDTAAVRLRVESDGRDFACSYKREGVASDSWTTIGPKVDGRFLTTARGGGFVGNVIGLYARSGGTR